jgi:serine/threonine-protein kinase
VPGPARRAFFLAASAIVSGIMADLCGRTISQCRILDSLGHGGMGVVYKAEDLKLGWVVALKFLAPHVSLSEEHRARFVREAKALAAIDHPNICAVHDIDETQGQLFLAMAFVDGPTLKDKIADGPLHLKEALRIVIDAAQGLHAAHKNGVVHRDIKSANIMLNADGRAMITDFGLAYSEHEASTSRMGTLIGTPAYMSPEQVRGERADRRSDLWSLGVVLYEAIGGRLPFPVDERPASTLTDEPEPLTSLRPGAPPELDRIVRRALAKSPSDRYQSAADLATDLRKLLEPALEKKTARKEARRPPSKTLALAALAAAVLIVAAGIALLTRQSEDPSSRPDLRQSIAVLPLQNLSGDPVQEYFTDGMTDAIITDLAKIGALRVISRSTSMAYRGRPDPVRAIAGDLHVHHVVEGSVLRAGDRVRITVQLIETTQDRHLWAQSYEGDLRDVLLLQSSVAQAIANEVRVRLTPGEQARLANKARVNPNAYEAFLRGRHLTLRWQRSDIVKGREYYRQAIAEDPNCAPACAGLADTYITEGFYWGARPADLFPQAEHWARQALKVDPEMAGPHHVLALVHGIYERNWPRARQEFERGSQLDPNSGWGRHTYAAYYLLPNGRLDEALREIQQARYSLPLSANIATMAGWVRFFRREYALAVEQFRKTLELEPDFLYARMGLAASLAQLGRFGEASAVDPPSETVAWLRALEGNKAESRGILSELLERSKREFIGGYELAHIHLALGENERALEQLERSYRDCQPQLANLKVDPRLDALRSDPRFAALVRKMNLDN